ncbi:MAG: KpsF/GutQ family sugar-phosphate isomerase [Flavobacteriales bacterium]|nr:KpsF/GutQ family sugar-phosphate isomerase [Flavobacteriales bacterium]MDG2247066.1 KpsF/GutQ family sugar-phosphate isomerase [Flavobacteriales bacterium]
MKDTQSILASARKTLTLEAEAVANLVNFLDNGFTQTVQALLSSSGRVVFTGIGKSANIANKLVATFNSTGTPALFMHAADAIHGDLGIVQPDDIVICISKSGNSPEIKALAPLVKSMGNTLVGFVGNLDSFLAQRSDLIVNTSVEKEACPNNLAPTTSTTAQLAMGDAIAICLMEARGFSAKDFAKYHPGGALGKKLYITLGDILTDAKPEVAPNTSLKEVIIEISANRLGAVAVVENDALKGVITDGDVRRMLERTADFSNLTAKDIMSTTPKTMAHDELAVEGYHVMESNSITQIVVTENGNYMGIVHLHDILREGIF